MKEIIKAQVIEIFDKVPLIKNRARKKFFTSILLGMIDGRKVQFKEIAIHIESKAKLDSVERNIQAFFKDYEFDYQKVCLLLVVVSIKG
jgi:hypothetical protein